MIFNSPIIRFFLIFFVSFGLVSLTSYANDSYGIVGEGKGLIYVVNVLSTFAYAISMGVLDSKLVITSHVTRALYRFFLLTIIPGILAIQHASYIPLSLAFMNYTLFWIIFELVYDEEKGKNPLSIGTTATIDKVMTWLEAHTFKGAEMLLKGLLAIASQILVIKYFFVNP